MTPPYTPQEAFTLVAQEFRRCAGEPHAEWFRAHLHKAGRIALGGHLYRAFAFLYLHDLSPDQVIRREGISVRIFDTWAASIAAHVGAEIIAHYPELLVAADRYRKLLGTRFAFTVGRDGLEVMLGHGEVMGYDVDKGLLFCTVRNHEGEWNIEIRPDELVPIPHEIGKSDIQ